jgi:TRAP-type C4-dicarboxylate transport system substrate-binding protein
MAFSEVFTSLQNGTLDGQENPLALIQSASFNEVQTHVNQTEHVRSWIYLAISEQAWSKLSEEDQGHVQEAAKVAQEFERKQFLADEQAIRADLEKKGMTFVEVDQKAFADASRDAVIKSVDESIRPTVEQLFAQ